MKILVFVAHPGMNEPTYGTLSKINKSLMMSITGQPDITVVDLSLDQNISAHQKLMEEHDRIVIQFPMFWFNMPGLAKKWWDDVLAYNWAYGSHYKLEGKELMIALSSGQLSEAFTKEGKIGMTLEDVFYSLKASAYYCKMKYLPIFHIGDAYHINDEILNQASKNYLAHITKSY